MNTTNQAERCLRCQGTDLKPGTLSGPFLPVSLFRPEGAGWASYKKHSFCVRATICLDCGFVQISGDPEEAKAVIKRIETE
jgi:hypothetical protein